MTELETILEILKLLYNCDSVVTTLSILIGVLFLWIQTKKTLNQRQKPRRKRRKKTTNGQ